MTEFQGWGGGVCRGSTWFLVLSSPPPPPAAVTRRMRIVAHLIKNSSRPKETRAQGRKEWNLTPSTTNKPSTWLSCSTTSANQLIDSLLSVTSSNLTKCPFRIKYNKIPPSLHSNLPQHTYATDTGTKGRASGGERERVTQRASSTVYTRSLNSTTLWEL